MSYTYDHERPSVTVDVAVFGYAPGDLRVLLIERGEEPFRGRWALPGGFVQMEEDLGDAARRELAEEAGVTPDHLEQLGAWGAPGRDPRGRVVTVAHLALVAFDEHVPRAATDAADARWFPADALPALAFDHDAILRAARAALVESTRTRPVGFKLVGSTFTMRALQTLVETVTGEAVDKRNFQKKVRALGLVRSTGEVEQGVPHRPARLFRFDEARLRSLTEAGFEFRL